MNQTNDKEVAYPDMSGNEVYALFCSMGWTCPPPAIGTYATGNAVVGDITLCLHKENFLINNIGKILYRPPETRINMLGMIYEGVPLSVPSFSMRKTELGSNTNRLNVEYEQFLHLCMYRVALVASPLWCEVQFFPDGRRPHSMHGFENEHREGDYRTLLRITRAWAYAAFPQGGGRKPVLTRESLLVGWQEFRDWCAATDNRFTKVGFAAHLGVDRDTLRDTLTREKLHFPPA